MASILVRETCGGSSSSRPSYDMPASSYIGGIAEQAQHIQSLQERVAELEEALKRERHRADLCQQQLEQCIAAAAAAAATATTPRAAAAAAASAAAAAAATAPSRHLGLASRSVRSGPCDSAAMPLMLRYGRSGVVDGVAPVSGGGGGGGAASAPVIWVASASAPVSDDSTTGPGSTSPPPYSVRPSRGTSPPAGPMRSDGSASCASCASGRHAAGVTTSERPRLASSSSTSLSAGGFRPSPLRSSEQEGDSTVERPEDVCAAASCRGVTSQTSEGSEPSAAAAAASPQSTAGEGGAVTALQCRREKGPQQQSSQQQLWQQHGDAGRAQQLPASVGSSPSAAAAAAPAAGAADDSYWADACAAGKPPPPPYGGHVIDVPGPAKDAAKDTVRVDCAVDADVADVGAVSTRGPWEAAGSAPSALVGWGLGCPSRGVGADGAGQRLTVLDAAEVMDVEAAAADAEATTTTTASGRWAGGSASWGPSCTAADCHSGVICCDGDGVDGDTAELIFSADDGAVVRGSEDGTSAGGGADVGVGGWGGAAATAAGLPLRVVAGGHQHGAAGLYEEGGVGAGEGGEEEEYVTISKREYELLLLKVKAMDVLQEGITIADCSLPDMPLIYANAGFVRTTGYGVDYVLGKNCRFLQGEGTDMQVVRELKEAITRGRACVVQLLNYKKNGDPFVNYLSLTPIHDATAGRLTHYVGVQSDITELVNHKRAELAAKHAALQAAVATEAKSQFLARMSHEIRTPLNGMIAVGQLLAETSLTPAQWDLVNTIRCSGETLLTLITDILDFSRIEANKMVLHNAVFKLDTVIEAAMEIAGLKAAQRRLQVAYHISEHVPRMLYGDAQRLQQILLNILNNGIKFTEEGELLLEVWAEGVFPPNATAAAAAAAAAPTVVAAAMSSAAAAAGDGGGGDTGGNSPADGGVLLPQAPAVSPAPLAPQAAPSAPACQWQQGAAGQWQQQHPQHEQGAQGPQGQGQWQQGPGPQGQGQQQGQVQQGVGQQQGGSQGQVQGHGQPGPESEWPLLVLRFAVRDTGIGIAPADLGRLFNSFTQVDASPTRRYGGSGLGLAISRKLCEAMGGHMWAQSDGLNTGSTFSWTITCRLPQQAAAARRRARRASLVCVSRLAAPPSLGTGYGGGGGSGPGSSVGAGCGGGGRGSGGGPGSTGGGAGMHLAGTPKAAAAAGGDAAAGSSSAAVGIGGSCTAVAAAPRGCGGGGGNSAAGSLASTSTSTSMTLLLNSMGVVVQGSSTLASAPAVTDATSSTGSGSDGSATVAAASSRSLSSTATLPPVAPASWSAGASYAGSSCGGREGGQRHSATGVVPPGAVAGGARAGAAVGGLTDSMLYGLTYGGGAAAGVVSALTGGGDPTASLPLLRGKKVLLVEPCIMVRQVLMLALRSWGCRVCAVASSQDAVRRLVACGTLAAAAMPPARPDPAPRRPSMALHHAGGGGVLDPNLYDTSGPYDCVILDMKATMLLRALTRCDDREAQRLVFMGWPGQNEPEDEDEETAAAEESTEAESSEVAELASAPPSSSVPVFGAASEANPDAGPRRSHAGAAAPPPYDFTESLPSDVTARPPRAVTEEMSKPQNRQLGYATVTRPVRQGRLKLALEEVLMMQLDGGAGSQRYWSDDDGDHEEEGREEDVGTGGELPALPPLPPPPHPSSSFPQYGASPSGPLGRFSLDLLGGQQDMSLPRVSLGASPAHEAATSGSVLQPQQQQRGSSSGEPSTSAPSRPCRGVSAAAADRWTSAGGPVACTAAPGSEGPSCGSGAETPWHLAHPLPSTHSHQHHHHHQPQSSHSGASARVPSPSPSSSSLCSSLKPALVKKSGSHVELCDLGSAAAVAVGGSRSGGGGAAGDPWATSVPSRVRILLAEDNAINMKVALGILKRTLPFAEVATAENGVQALEAVAARGGVDSFDLILMDLHMPVMGGMGAVAELGQRYPHRRCRVVAVTADAFEDTRDSCLAAGFDGWLTKPFRIEDLVRVVGEHLGVVRAAAAAAAATAGGTAPGAV